MFKDISWGTLTVFSRVLIQWLILVILNKFFDLEIVGDYTLSLAIISPIFMFCGLQLRNIQIVDVKNDFCFFDYFYTRVLAVGLGIILSIVIGIIINVNLEILLCIILVKSIEQINDIIYGYYQKNKNFNLYGISNILKVSIEVILLVLLIYKFFYLYFVICFSINLLFIWIYDFKKHLYTEVNHFSINQIKFLLKKTFPLGVSALISSMTTNVPRYLVVYFLSIKMLGIYGSIFYLCTGFLIVYQPLFMSLRVRMSAIYSKDKAKFKKYQNKVLRTLLVILFFGCVFIYLFSDIIFKLLLTNQYLPYKNLLVGIFFGLGVSNLINVYSISLQIKQVLNKQMYISIYMLFISILLCYICLYLYQLNGLILSTILIGITNFYLYKYLDNKYE